MERITIFLVLFLASCSLVAQTTYGTNAGTQGGNTASYFGHQAGRIATAQHNSFLGYRSGYNNTTGKNNTFAGSLSGLKNSTGSRNTYIGNYSGYYSTTGNNNTAVGVYAGYRNTTGTKNTYLGNSAGFKNITGTGNVFIGNQAGYFQTGNNKLFIDNSTTNAPLIYGDFASNEVKVNGDFEANKLTVNKNICLPNAIKEHTGNVFLGGDAIAQEGMRLFGGSINSGEYSGGFIDVASDNLEQGLRFRVNIAGTGIFEERMMIKANGKVLIGTTKIPTPGTYKLFVEEGILTEKVKIANVSSSDWADYVFADDYELNSVQEVEAFINENKHLPNVPSAKEVSENGINVAEMDATLLRQIEELWLHVIELKKENAELKAKVEGH